MERYQTLIQYVNFRLYVAGLHFNENGKRQQSRTKDGQQKWKLSYPKAKKGEECVVKPQKVAPTFGNYIYQEIHIIHVAIIYTREFK